MEDGSKTKKNVSEIWNDLICVKTLEFLEQKKSWIVVFLVLRKSLAYLKAWNYHTNLKVIKHFTYIFFIKLVLFIIHTYCLYSGMFLKIFWGIHGINIFILFYHFNVLNTILMQKLDSRIEKSTQSQKIKTPRKIFRAILQKIFV